MDQAGIGEALRFAAALSDGHSLSVFRWSSDPLAPSVYYRHTATALIVVSEPIDDHADGWQALATNHVLTTRCGESAERPVIAAFDAGVRKAASLRRVEAELV